MGEINVSVYVKVDYEVLCTLKAAKNKANSKPNKANRRVSAHWGPAPFLLDLGMVLGFLPVKYAKNRRF